MMPEHQGPTRNKQTEWKRNYWCCWCTSWHHRHGRKGKTHTRYKGKEGETWTDYCNRTKKNKVKLE